MLNLYLENHLNFVEGKKRARKISVMEMLGAKYERKAELKEKQLELKRMEVEIAQQRFVLEEERKQHLQIDIAEKKTFLQLIKRVSIRINFIYMSSFVLFIVK